MPSQLRNQKKQRGIFERPKGSGVWWIRYADEFGKIHREKVGMKSVAIAELIEDRLPAAKMLRSSRNELHHLKYWEERFGNQAVRSIVVKDIETAKAELLEGANKYDPPRPLRPASVNRFLASL